MLGPLCFLVVFVSGFFYCPIRNEGGCSLSIRGQINRPPLWGKGDAEIKEYWHPFPKPIPVGGWGPNPLHGICCKDFFEKVKKA